MTKNIEETYISNENDSKSDQSATYIDTGIEQATNQTDIGITLHPGETIGGSYSVTRQLNTIGAQSRVYLARKNDEVCVIKLYKPGYTPNVSILDLLIINKCPYVAELLDYGYQKECFFEIYRYYSEGTLANEAKYSMQFIKEVVIPNINEGLHYLHTLGGSGIVHGDIKPSNIFISNNGSNVVIGDFGISTILDRNGKKVDDIKGTPEYSPRLVSFYGKAVKTTDYDYASLGLVLIKLATGHSLFEGMDAVEINDEWERGLRIPTTLDTRLKDLVRGLTLESTEQRYGYKEVKKWCEGEYLSVSKPSDYDKKYFEKKEIKPLMFGIFDNKVITVSNNEDLFDAITTHWEHSKKVLQRESFFEFIAQIMPDKEQELRNLSNNRNLDEVVFYTLYSIHKNSTIYFKGRNLGTFESLIMDDSGILSPELDEFLSKGYLCYFLKCNEVNEKIIDQVDQIVSLTKTNPFVMLKTLRYIFSKQKVLVIGENLVSSLEELGELLSIHDIEKIDSIARLPELIAWFLAKGYLDEATFLLNYKEKEYE